MDVRAAVAWKAGALPADNSGTGDAVADGAFSLDAMQQGGAHFLVYDHPPRSEGFWHAVDAMHDPSVTKTFGASQTWFIAFSTEVFGSDPMRAPPHSWMAPPTATLRL